MKLLIATLLLAFLQQTSIAQGSDFILLKKNDRTIKTIYSGINLSFGNASGFFSGKITAIKRDSLFFVQYDIRQLPTNLGIFIPDTVATYKLGFNYHDIDFIGHKTAGFNLAASGGSLFGGGIVLTTFGLGTWIFTKPGTQYYASPTLVIGGAVLGGIGYLLLKSNNSYKLGKKYHLEYVGISKEKR